MQKFVKKIYFSSLIVFTACSGVVLHAQPFALISGTSAAIVIDSKEPECVQLAVKDLVSDVEKITGKQIAVLSSIKSYKGNYILIGSQTVAASKLNIKKILPTAYSFLNNQWEAYLVQSINHNLIISGSDERGTMFAIYDFIENYLGVDPMYFWSDIPYPKKSFLQWDTVGIRQSSPTFKYRGVFINDEDLLTEFYKSGGKRNIDYPFYQEVVNPELMRQVLEAAVRLRYNLIIPASFLNILNPAEEALIKEVSKRGMFISMHHVEPMGVSAFTFFNYWKQKGKQPKFSFFSNKDELEEVWKVYATAWAKYPNVIWQVGLRGIGDRPMWMADPGMSQSDVDRGKLISEAVESQMKIIHSVDKRKQIPITSTLWAEGSILFQQGFLKFPTDVMLIFADNTPGWKWQQDFYAADTTKRIKYGVYYHHQLWGTGPHLAQAVPPCKTQAVIKEAIDRGYTNYAILNISNIREYLIGTSISSKLLYNYSDNQQKDLLAEWVSKHYKNNQLNILAAYNQFFNSYVLSDETKLPVFLDGQNIGDGYNSIVAIKEKLKNTDNLKTKLKDTLESEFINRFLGDMHVSIKNGERKIEKLALQQAGFFKTGLLLDGIEKNIDSVSFKLLQTNLRSHQLIMLGLTLFTENAALANRYFRKDSSQKSLYYLQLAIENLQLVQQGMNINTANKKWQFWYMGDKKMNVSGKIKLIEELIKEMSELPGLELGFRKSENKADN